MPDKCELSEATLTAGLHRRGRRITKQRRAIYEAVAHCKGHPTVEDVFRFVRNTMPRVSLATVYNGLEALAAVGEIGKIPRTESAPAQYELRTDVHHHARCVGCHRVWDLDKPATELPIAEMLGKRKFKPLAARVEVLIECPVKTNTPLGQVPNSICPLDTTNPAKKKIAKQSRRSP